MERINRYYLSELQVHHPMLSLPGDVGSEGCYQKTAADQYWDLDFCVHIPELMIMSSIDISVQWVRP